MKLIFLGPPGSGKGTQATLFKNNFNTESISTGDLLRSEIDKSSRIGLEAKSYMNKGDLVPDEIVLGLIKMKISNTNNYILDGFPRSENQAIELDNILKEINHKIDLVVNFVVPDDIIIKRILGRYICSKCGEVYNDYFKQPKVAEICDKCKSNSFKRRNDDNEETLKNRLNIFHKSNDLLCNYYKKNNLLISIEAIKNEDFIFNLLKNTIENKVNL